MSILTRAERETIIRRSDDERGWDIYSACPRDISRIRKAVAAFGGTISEGPHGDIRATLPLKAITFRQTKPSSNPSGIAALAMWRENQQKSDNSAD